GQSVISATLGTAIQGGSFTDNFKAALLSQVSGQVHTEGANFIGTQGEILGYPGKALSHAVLSGLTAEISRGNVKGAVVGGLAAELAAISLGDNLINAEQWQKKSAAQAQLARAFGGIAGAVFTGQPGGVYSGATAAENSFRYNYLSHHQQTLMEKELAATPNDFKKALISLKWGYTSLDQDVSLGAGMVAGTPVGLYETLDGLANLASNPKETYTAIKAVLQSDDTLGIISDAVKHSYIARLERMEAEYQKAGTAGAFNAGLEVGKIIFDIASTLAGGAGVAKGGAILIEKVVAKAASKGEAAAINAGKTPFYVEEPPFNQSGTGGAAQPWSTKGRINHVQLPNTGKIRYVPPEGYSPSQPLPRGPNNGYIDKFKNEWVKGPSRTAGQSFEWDIQLSSQGKSQLGWATRDGSHLNVSLDGKITHK
ncbi:polymorphic toxin type 17 domain-containing protein, partial [Arsenophonus nasoniae]|uniref:polymorphic toxin type 17 domain-containing protein n=1 Tax=Arsenophonus nasoniae TaxID=638 RepID=UPI001B7F8E86